MTSRLGKVRRQERDRQSHASYCPRDRKLKGVVAKQERADHHPRRRRYWYPANLNNDVTQLKTTQRNSATLRS